MAMAIDMAMAIAMAMAMAVIRPEHSEGARNHENPLFCEKHKSMKKRNFGSILVDWGPSRPQKWIRLEIYTTRPLET